MRNGVIRSHDATPRIAATKYWAFIVFALSIWFGLSPALRAIG